MNEQKSEWLEKIKQTKMLKKYVKEQSVPLNVVQPPELKNDYYIKFLEHLGFKNIKVNGDQIYCKFPQGWKKVITFLSDNFVYLVDDKGRKRASIFYKFLGNFNYELDKDKIDDKTEIPLDKKLIKISTYINWLPRYIIAIRHLINYPMGKNITTENIEKYYNSPIYGCIIDNATDKNIYETRKCILPEKYIHNEKNTKYFLLEKKYKDSLYDECIKFLDINYPENSNILKYWSEWNIIFRLYAQK